MQLMPGRCDRAWGRKSASSRRVTCRVFANDLLEGACKDSPREDLDILLNVARLRTWEAHDDLEELFALRLGLGHGLRSEAFKIATNAVLLFYGEADSDQRLQKLDSINTGDVAAVLLFPPNAVDVDAARRLCMLFGCDGLE